MKQLSFAKLPGESLPDGGKTWATPELVADDPTMDDRNAAFALWPNEAGGKGAEMTYRYTGRFGAPPNRVGILLRFEDEASWTALAYQIGVGRSRRGRTNHVLLIEAEGGKVKTSDVRSARGDWFNDGNVHTMSVRLEEGRWVLSLDGTEQLAVPRAAGAPCGVFASRAAVAIYGVAWPR